MFPVALMQNLKCWGKKLKIYHERRREEKEKREEKRREGVVQTMLTLFAYVHSPLFH